MSKTTNKNDKKPATKGFVRDEIAELAEAVKVGFDNTATKGDLKKFATKDDLKQLGSQMRYEMKAMKNEILYEFKAVAENIHKDVAGANKDEISLMKNQQIPDLNDRLEIVEEKTGVPVGPRYS